MTGTQLKALLLVLFILMFISLFNGVFVLFKDNGNPESRRTFQKLAIRAALAVAIFSTMAYGFYTGKLHSRAPWSQPHTSAPSR